MLISTLFVIAQSILIPAYGANASSADLCRQLFDKKESTSRVAQALFKDLYELSQKEGTPDKSIHLKLNDNAQLRIYTRQPIVEIGESVGERVVYLEILRPIHDLSTREDMSILERAYGPLLQTVEISGGNYRASRWEPMVEIPVDIHTGYMRADNKTVVRLIESLVASRGKEQSNAMLFVDLDNLSIMNYMAGGHAFGDRYIRESLRVIAENLRVREGTSDRADKRDVPFRLQNGDEYFFLLQGVTPKSLEAIKARINEAFREDPAILELVAEARASYTEFLTNLRKIQSYEQLLQHSEVHKFILESKLWKQLGASLQTVVIKDAAAFQAFVQQYVESPEVNVRGERLLALQLGVSIGGVMIRPDHVYQTLYVEADLAMRQDKISRKLKLKNEIPLDLIEYNKPDIYFPPLDL